MATGEVNITEDAEMAECDGDKVVTMLDVLQEQQDFEEDANAVLGASDDKNCTYPKGYIKRQALYACLTCCTEAKVDPTKRAGVCLACSLACHENHELIELYTKRNFRCDCGNPKFNSHPCQFTSDKTELNDDNIYNQNFSGLYCTCQRPYPDPDSTIEDDMIQCIICEDWLHASHLEAVVPANDQYSEMVCKSCMEKNEFLHDYSIIAVTVEAGDVDIVTVNGDSKSVDGLCNGDLEKEKLINGVEENKTEIEPTSVTVNGGDVEMDEAKEKDKVKDETDNKKDEESQSSESKQDELSSTESTELKSEENTKSNTDDSKMNVDTESKIAEQEEQSIDITEIKEEKEISEATSEKSDETESATTANEIPAEEIKDIKNEKMESTDNELEKADETKKQTKTQEQISKVSTTEDGDNSQENITDNNERTEQQLLDDLNALTSDNTTSDEKQETAMDEKPLESMEKSEDNKEKDEVETNKEDTSQETANESGDKSEDKPVIENESATGSIEVPDTSQTEKDVKQNDEEKADAVMDAIDELLQTANEAKEKESAEETKEPTRESSESKETTENVEAKESEDVEMSASENKVPKKEDDIADTNDKPSANTDVAMDTQNEPTSVSKVEPTTNSESTEEKSEVNDSISQENVALKTDDKLETLNETDSELKTSSDNDSTNKTESSKDENEVPSVTENTKEHKRKLSRDATDDISPKKVKLHCVRPKDVQRVHKGATFWPSNFRQKLCTCGECLSMYKDLKVLFLTDLDDTVFAYESLGKENVAGGASQYEKGLQALSSLDRIQQINALTEYNRMRDKLLDFLKSFKDRKEIVKEEDIKAFFAGMKPRREPDGVYFCR